MQKGMEMLAYFNLDYKATTVVVRSTSIFADIHNKNIDNKNYQISMIFHYNI